MHAVQHGIYLVLECCGLTHLPQVIRENIEVFKRNGFEFVESNQQQHQQQPQPKPADANAAVDQTDTTAADADETATAAAAAEEEEDVGHDLENYGHDLQETCKDHDHDHSDLLLSSIPLVRGSGAAGVLGEEVLVELLDLIAAGDRKLEDLRPKRSVSAGLRLLLLLQC